MSKGLEEKFGICGYVADGAVLRDGTKLKNLRIHKQRSDEMFDLIDPKTNIIYEFLNITGYDIKGGILDYNQGNDSVLQQIKNDHFFVRAYSDNPDISTHGFVQKFLYNKVNLSNSQTLYEMYHPECPIYHGDIDNVLINPVHVGDTVISGQMFDAAGSIDSSGMVVTVTTPDGKVFSTDDIVNGKFEISPVELDVTGTATLVVTSDFYDTKTVPFEILPAAADSDFVTSIAVSKFIQSGDLYTAQIPSSVHQRGDNLIIEVQDLSGNIVMPDVIVDNGDINISSYSNDPIQVLIIGETLQSMPYRNNFTSGSWAKFGDEYKYTISSSKHLRDNISYSVYDMLGDLVQCGVEVSADESITLSSYQSFSGNIVIA